MSNEIKHCPIYKSDSDCNTRKNLIEILSNTRGVIALDSKIDEIGLRCIDITISRHSISDEEMNNIFKTLRGQHNFRWTLSINYAT